MEKKQMNDPTLDEQKSFDFGKIPDFPPDYPIPPILPTVGEHPRVWVKDADVKMIRAHLYDESNRVCLEKIEKSAWKCQCQGKKHPEA